ncbi:MAG: tetratricopeptide repeat protein [Candidatus Kuenenia sp.]|nr:tetratricopeptide repeat protein [Candidatus Kuenenia hertensis]
MMFTRKLFYLSLIFYTFIIGCGNKADSLNKKGLSFFNQKKYDDAIVEFKKALEVNPNHYEARYDLGMAYYAKGMIDESLAELKRAIELNPKEPKAHYNIAFAYMAKQMVPEAIQEYKTAIDLFSTKKDLLKEAEAHLYLSVAYSLMENHEKALLACKKAIELNPKLEDGHYFLGVCYYKNNMYDEAIVELKKTIELNPKAEKAHSVLQVIYDKLGMTDEAMKEKFILQQFSQDRRNRN